MSSNDSKATMPDFTPEPWTWRPGGQAYSFERPGEADELAETLRHLEDPDDDIGYAVEYLDGGNRPVMIPWDYEGYRAGVWIRPGDARLFENAPRMYRLLRALLDTDAKDWDPVLLEIGELLGQLERPLEPGGGVASEGGAGIRDRKSGIGKGEG